MEIDEYIDIKRLYDNLKIRESSKISSSSSSIPPEKLYIIILQIIYRLRIKQNINSIFQ
jgi:hypothetical protein